MSNQSIADEIATQVSKYCNSLTVGKEICEHVVEMAK